MLPLPNASKGLIEKWKPLLEGITDDYSRMNTAILLENEAKQVLKQRQDLVNEGLLSEEALSTGATKTGHLGVFPKFAFPLVRRVYPELIANSIIGVQNMSQPVGLVFYLGHDRVSGSTIQNVYTKYKLTYRGFVTSSIGSSNTSGTGTFGGGTTGGLDSVGLASFDLSSVLRDQYGSPSATFGGQIASWPDSTTTYGWNLSAGERLDGTAIPEVTFHIQTATVQARTRKMRALWTIEAAQDLKAYHNLELEGELSQLVNNEMKLEIDRELIEDVRMIAYGFNNSAATTRTIAGWDARHLDQDTPFSIPTQYGKSPNGGSEFAGGSFEYDWTKDTGDSTVANVFVIDLSSSSFGGWRSSGSNFAPQHLGHVYSNLLALINFASQDIYKTTFRGPGNWMICSPVMGSILESAAKLEGGLPEKLGPTNMGTSIAFKGKFAGKYDMFIDPMYPDDEILMGYKGSSPMDAGFIYAPYIPLMELPKVVDPGSFQPRKGWMTRYGKTAVTPQSRFYRVIRVIGVNQSIFNPFVRVTSINGTTARY